MYILLYNQRLRFNIIDYSLRNIFFTCSDRYPKEETTAKTKVILEWVYYLWFCKVIFRCNLDTIARIKFGFNLFSPSTTSLRDKQRRHRGSRPKVDIYQSNGSGENKETASIHGDQTTVYLYWHRKFAIISDLKYLHFLKIVFS